MYETMSGGAERMMIGWRGIYQDVARQLRDEE